MVTVRFYLALIMVVSVPPVLFLVCGARTALAVVASTLRGLYPITALEEREVLVRFGEEYRQTRRRYRASYPVCSLDSLVTFRVKGFEREEM